MPHVFAVRPTRLFARPVLPLPRFSAAIRLLALVLITAGSNTAVASPFGEVVRASAIGEAFEVELRTRGLAAHRILDCVTLPPQPSAPLGIETLQQPLIAVRTQGPETRLIIRQTQPISEPIVVFTLLERCTSQLQRTYTVLLDAPAALTPAPPVAASAHQPHHNANARTASTSTQGTHSRTTPVPPAPVRHPARTPAPKGERSAQASSPAPAPEVGTAADANPLPRLRIESGLESNTTAPLNTSSPDSAPTQSEQDRETRIVEALDRSIKLQLELIERLNRLEAAHSGLKAHLTHIAPSSLTQPLGATGTRSDAPASDIPERTTTPTDTDRPTKQTGWLLGGAALALLLIIAAVAWRWHQSRRVVQPEHSAEPETEQPVSPSALASAAEAATEIPIAIPSARPEAPTTPSPAVHLDQAQDAADLPLHAPAPLEPLDFELDIESEPPLILHESNPEEEHDSALELAEIMISFGRVEGAAETLADFIRANPKQAITPWLKLMEVYRLAGMRMEFDALTRQLNKTFNVRPVTWDNFEAARAASSHLEDMPHIIDTLTQQWGTRECQAYLETLLRDNRDGAREGFPISIIDEILLLAAVLEEQLGRFQRDERHSTPQTVP